MKSLQEKVECVRERHSFSNGRLPEADIFFQGGGMLGPAHLGALHALETLGFRLRKAAGTSAGAIVATLTAAATAAAKKNDGSELKAIAEMVFEDMAKMKPSTFLDGPSTLRTWVLAQTTGTPRRVRAWASLRAFLPGTRRLANKAGLHPARMLESWLDERLRHYKIHSLSDIDALKDNLKVVTAALPAGIKLVFPDQAGIFNIDPRLERPSLYARASMAVPFVFEPVELPLNAEKWGQFCRNELKNQFSLSQCDRLALADRAVLFDGGIFSNLPVDVFGVEDDSIPRFALALYSSQKEPFLPGLRKSRRSLFRYFGQLLDAARGLRDREARSQLIKGHRLEVIWIDTGTADWLDFSDDFDQVERLFESGVNAVGGYFK